MNDPLEVLRGFNLDPKRAAAFKPDPLNPRHYIGLNGDSSVVDLNPERDQWLTPLPNIPEGKIRQQKFRSAILKNERDIWIYTPPGYKNSGAVYDLLVTTDGRKYIDNIPVPVILNNLLAKKTLPPAVPPTVAVIIGNAEGARLKELWHDDGFNDFVTRELIPWVRKNYHVTTRADKTTIAGSSLGGNAVVYLALKHPEIFGNVISQSGGFMYPQRRTETLRPPLGGEFLEENFPEKEFLARQFAAAPKLPIRFYLEAGLMEDAIWRETPPRFASVSLLASTRHLRDVLRAKGYSVCYHEFNGAHEDLSWRETFSSALLKLSKGECRF